jgi:pimeloyl-ACP methyl ester carboxylesterase
MAYLVGAALGLGIGAFATIVGFDRSRSFYPVALVVIASYYDLFAVMGGSVTALAAEALTASVFIAVAVIGYRTSLWLIVAALVAHGTLDVVHHEVIANPGVPAWWPAFCMTIDLAMAGYLAVRLLRAKVSRAVDARRTSEFKTLPENLLPLRQTTPWAAHALLAAALLLCGMVGATGCSAAPTDVRTVQVDGHAVAYRVLGQGRPVVVLISGTGDGMASFEDVAPELAKRATVILYDRAGYGLSGDPSAPRDAAAVDRELREVLRASGVAGHYVIAGHSVGGLYAEYFAAKHPGDVDALILDDSRPVDFTRRCESAKISMCVVTSAMVRFGPQGARAEVAALDETMAEVDAVTLFAGRRVLVLSHPTGSHPTPFDALWTQAQGDLAARYPGSSHLTAPGGGHYVHRDQRAWFVGAVTNFLGPLQ